MKLLALTLFAALTTQSLAHAGNARAEGPVPQFTLPSELRYIDINPDALTYAGMKDKEIAITVDDGPDPKTTPVILKTFRDHGVKATFFLVGRRAQAYPDMVKLILQEGHSVGNHTWDHANMQAISKDAFKKQVVDTQAVLNKIGQEAGIPIQPFFRFPFGSGASNASLKAILKDLGLGNFYWSMSAHDSRTQDPTVALNTSIGMIDSFKKGIFLMHETHPAGLKMLPYFLAELHNRDYKTIYFKAAPAKAQK